MPYGQIKVDEITFTNAGVDQTISVSGVVGSISGNITATGTISGNVIRGGTLVSGATVTGTAGQFGTITGNTAAFTTVTGTTVTGTTANFVTVSGTTVTGATAQFTTLTGGTAGFTTITGTTVTGTTANFVTVSGTTVTGNVGQFTTVTGGTAGFTTVTGTTITGTTLTVASGTFTGNSTAAAFIPTGITVPTNGVYLPAANTVGVATNGAQRIVVDSTGQVGIGTSSPSIYGAQLAVIGGSVHADRNIGSGAAQVQFSMGASSGANFGQIGNTGTRWSLGYGGTANTIGTEVLVWNSSGNVGIGTTSPGFLVTAVTSADGADGVSVESPSVNGVIRLRADGTNGNAIRVGGVGAQGNTLRFLVGSDAERMRIDSSGGFRVKGAGTAGVSDAFFINGSAPASSAQLDSSGRLLVGTSTARSNFFNTTVAAQHQLEGTTLATSLSSIVRTDATANSGFLVLAKSRGASVGTNTIVQDADGIGAISFQGNDGTEFVEAASIRSEVDGTPGANDMPGRLVFSTTADGASSPTERVRINNAGRLMCGQDNRNATLETDDQFVIQGNGYTAFHALNGTAYTIGQNSNSRTLRIGSGSGWATSGVSLAAGGTSWGTYSDERLKTDIVELTDCLESIKDIRCVSYRLTDLDETDSKKRLGVIAQDLVGKYDEAISTSQREPEDETEYLSVQYTDLIPVLLKALQEATIKIETLEAKVAALESA